MQVEWVSVTYAELIMAILATALAFATWFIFKQEFKIQKISIKSWICVFVTTVGTLVTWSGVILGYFRADHKWFLLMPMGIQYIGWAISAFAPMVLTYWYAIPLAARFNLKVHKPSKKFTIFRYIMAAIIILALLWMGVSDILSDLYS